MLEISDERMSTPFFASSFVVFVRECGRFNGTSMGCFNEGLLISPVTRFLFIVSEVRCSLVVFGGGDDKLLIFGCTGGEVDCTDISEADVGSMPGFTA